GGRGAADSTLGAGRDAGKNLAGGAAALGAVVRSRRRRLDLGAQLRLRSLVAAALQVGRGRRHPPRRDDLSVRVFLAKSGERAGDAGTRRELRLSVLA